MGKENNSKKKYRLVPLSQLVHSTPYSLEYLSLRARHGKLKAEKIKRVWHSTEHDIRVYLNQQAEIAKAKTPELKKFYKTYTQKSLEPLARVVASEDLWDRILLGEKIPTEAVSSTISSLKKETPAFKKRKKFILNWQFKPIIGGLLTASVITFLIFFSPGGIFTKLGNIYKPFFNNIFTVSEGSSKLLLKSFKESASDINKNLEETVLSFVNLTDDSMNIIINTSRSFSRVFILPIKKVGTTVDSFENKNIVFMLGSLFDKIQDSLTRSLEKTNELFSFFGNAFEGNVIKAAEKIKQTGLVLENLILRL